MIFRLLENLTKIFPGKSMGKPPASLLVFCLFYCREMWFALVVMAILSAVIAAI